MPLKVKQTNYRRKIVENVFNDLRGYRNDIGKPPNSSYFIMDIREIPTLRIRKDMERG